jgi:hypothetical protein
MEAAAVKKPGQCKTERSGMTVYGSGLRNLADGYSKLPCSVNDAVNVLPCSTCAYLNGWLS